MQNKRHILFLLLAGAILFRAGQVSAQSNELDWASLRQLVLSGHPGVQRADLLRNQAQAALVSAKGGFDLKTFADYDAKSFKGTNYFQFAEAGVKLPTYAGLELKGAYNYADGNYLNPENTLPATGQATLGLTWSLGQGLMIDERRAKLRQARIGLFQNEAERNALINDVLLDASKAYWSWVLAQNQLSVYQEALRQARIRHNALRESFLYGDKPGIDTVESFIQLQTREMDLFMAELELKNTGAELRNHLWAVNTPSAVLAAKAPSIETGSFVVIDSFEIAELAQNALSSHPLLASYAAKRDFLEVERRLKREKRKPVFDLNYNILGSGWSFFPGTGADGTPGVLANNMKWGAGFSFPLQNRKATGDYQITQIKIAENNLAITQKQREIDVKTNLYANELNTLARQIALQEQQVVRYRTLLDAELEKFRFGESSVFLINTREQRWLESQIKYQKLLSEYRKAEAGLLWAAGILAERTFLK